MPSARSTPDLTLPIDGKSYIVRYSLKALARLQDHFQLASINEVGAKLAGAEDLGAADMAAMLWAGLATHHPDVTLDQAMDLADSLGPAGLMSEMSEALSGAVAPRDQAGRRDDHP